MEHEWEGKPMLREDLLLKDEVYAIVGAAMAVHNELRSGFAECVYQESIEIELALRGIPFERQKQLIINYKGRPLESLFFADLVCYGSIIVELKSQRNLAGYEEAQVINYLRATGLRVGLLINFGDPGRLDWHRYVV
jgi:GxxExxY protein